LGKNRRKKIIEKEIIFPNLKPTTRAISIGITDYLLNRIREIANKAKIPYQSSITIYLKKAFGL